MRKALYRSYRPRRFCEVIGQDAAAEALRNEVAAGRVGHAYILSGTRGTGKTTLARILAKAVNCPNQKHGEPCCECEICRGIDNGSILDVSEVDAASTTGVDNIRSLRDEAAYTPAVASMRVYIIDEVHMLSASAWSALLKIIEEPPEHVMFILATTDIQKVLPTILSRCQRFDLKRIPAPLIAEKLSEIAEKEAIDLAPEAAALISRLADGAMRDALSLLDTAASFGERVDEAQVRRVAGITDRGYLFSLSDKIEARDKKAVLLAIDELYAMAVEPTRLASELIKHYRCLLAAKLAGDAVLGEYPKDEQQRFIDAAKELAERELSDRLELLLKLYCDIVSAQDKRLMLELSLLSLCETKPQELTRATPDDTVKKTARQLPETASAPTVQAEPHGTPKAKPVPAQSPQLNEPDVPEGQLDCWDRVVDAMKQKNLMLYGFMSSSRAFKTKTHLLIDASDVFMKYMREHPEAAQLVKAVIAEQTGLRMPIGPYEAKKAADQEDEKSDPVEELLKRARGADIEVDVK